MAWGTVPKGRSIREVEDHWGTASDVSAVGFSRFHLPKRSYTQAHLRTTASEAFVIQTIRGKQCLFKISI